MTILDHLINDLADAITRADLIAESDCRQAKLFSLGMLDAVREYKMSEKRDTVELEIDIAELETGLGQHQTSAQTNNISWRDRSIYRFLAGSQPRRRPRAILVLGQPGAGKGPVVEDLARQFALHGNAVIVDAEELKYLHPAYSADAGSDDRNVMPTIGPEIDSLAEELTAQAIEGRYHLIVESAPADADRIAATIERLKKSDYHVTVIALAVSPEVSWQSVADRCKRQQEHFEVGTWVGREYHDACCRDLADAVEAVEREGMADQLLIITRSGARLLSVCRPAFRTGEARCVLAGFFPPAAEPPQSLPIAEPPAASEERTTTQTTEPSKGRKIKLGSFPAAASGEDRPSETGVVVPSPQSHSPVAPSSPLQGKIERKIKLGSFSKELSPPKPPPSQHDPRPASRSKQLPKIAPQPIPKRNIESRPSAAGVAQPAATPKIPPEQTIEKPQSKKADSTPVRGIPDSNLNPPRSNEIPVPSTSQTPEIPSVSAETDDQAMHSSLEDTAIRHRLLLQQKIRQRADA